MLYPPLSLPPHRVHLPQLQKDDTSLFLLHFTIAVKELDSLSKVLVVDELIRRQTLARPAALSPADSSGGEFLHRTVPTGWGPATGCVPHPFGNLAADGTLERSSGGEIVPPLEHPLNSSSLETGSR